MVWMVSTALEACSGREFLRDCSWGKRSRTARRGTSSVQTAGEPVLITGMESKAVLISEEVWRGIQATLDLVSIPGMRASIRDGMGTALHELSSEPLW